MGTWTFEQLKGDKKKLVLAGWDGPKGRPGQTPVVSPQTTVRQSEVYYPGNDTPSRFTYGSKQEPIELEGTFRDLNGGIGYALQMKRFAEDFVNEQLQCYIAWEDRIGTVVSYLGTIEWWKSEVKSPAHIGWKCSVLIDQNLELHKKSAEQPPPRTFPDWLAGIKAGMAGMLAATRTGKSISTFPPSLDFGLSDFIDSLTSYVTGPIAMLNALSSQLADMSTATMGSIKRAQAGVHQLKTGILNMQQTFASLSRDASVISNSASEDLDFFTTQNGVQKACGQLLKQANDWKRDLERAEQGLIGGMVTAQNNDTWEAIAVRSLGDANRASAIQQMNGETGPPVPGTTYLIPK